MKIKKQKRELPPVPVPPPLPQLKTKKTEPTTIKIEETVSQRKNLIDLSVSDNTKRLRRYFAKKYWYILNNAK